MSHGPLMLDLCGTSMSPQEREMLLHPATGGVILFARNYESPAQLRELTQAIHALRRPKLLIAVDQEGGRVQRFREGFARLPPLAWFGERHAQNPEQARAAARQLGWLMASELRASGVDFSFAPVLDLGDTPSRVIGDRGFHGNPEVVAELATQWVWGAREAGMASVGKHFPGHGSVLEDSHHEVPRDQRRFEDLLMSDLISFERLIAQGLEAMMPAHVIYEQIDAKPAGFSNFWLQQVLRQRLNFQGVIFSDDLSMAAAAEGGSYPERARAALAAGCDMVLVCNNPEAAGQVLQELRDYSNPVSQARLICMHGRKEVQFKGLRNDPRWRKAIALAAEAVHSGPEPELKLV